MEYTMIRLTDLQGRKRDLKASLIKEMKTVPDTVLLLMNGNCLVVQESVEEIINVLLSDPRAMDYRAAEVLY